ncbi:uncharacterized protein LOC141530048 [Cotesia typhae]|uniref:uncharacterized protein LOC141530048 n=1 Tax=Cotesia typhae TaxID=2053667 RepID=UPI003D68D5B6
MSSKINTVLFDPGGSDVSCGCSGVDELKAKAYRNDAKTGDNYNERSKLSEPKYSPKVLEGNWFEERLRSPAYNIKENNNDSHWSTSTKNDFKPLVRKITQHASESAKKNKEKNKGADNLLYDQKDNLYLNNFTTSYDLTYRIIPQGLDGPRLRSYNGRINKWLPEQDFTKSVGNLTGYGMTEYLRAVEEELNCEKDEKPRTSYQRDYTKKKLPVDLKRFHRKRINLNTPDLSTFNFDLNKYWKSPFNNEFNGKDLCQRVACGQY